MAYNKETLETINKAYQDTFGRDASFDTLGGASYWADAMENKGLTTEGLLSALQASPEGQSVTTDPNTGKKSSWLGGVNPNKSVAEQLGEGTWADHFMPPSATNPTGGGLTGDLTGTIWEGMEGAGTATSPTTGNVASLLNATYNTNNPNAALPNPYYQNPLLTKENINNLINSGTFTGTGTNTTTTQTPITPVQQTGWWNQFADADAFKDFLTGGQQNKSGGMDDFMKFMMFMSMMRPQGGGGYGGSQYGYGGLNPGGVQSAYNPLDSITSAISAFQSLPGIGGGTGLNTGTATA